MQGAGTDGSEDRPQVGRLRRREPVTVQGSAGRRGTAAGCGGQDKSMEGPLAGTKVGPRSLKPRARPGPHTQSDSVGWIRQRSVFQEKNHLQNREVVLLGSVTKARTDSANKNTGH